MISEWRLHALRWCDEATRDVASMFSDVPMKSLKETGASDHVDLTCSVDPACCLSVMRWVPDMDTRYSSKRWWCPCFDSVSDVGSFSGLRHAEFGLMRSLKL